MTGHSLGIRTWRFAVLALALLANGACPSGGDDSAQGGTGGKSGGNAGGGNAGGGGAGSGNAGGKAPDSPSGGDTCKDDSTILLPSDKGRLIGDITTDDDAIYFSQGSGEAAKNGIFRLPKAGGEPTKLGEMDNLVDGGPILLDGDYLYYGDSQLNRIKKDGSSGAPEMLFEAKGGVSDIASDKDAIYFVYGAFCCDSLGTDTTQHLMRMDKASSMVTEVVSAPAIDSLASDGDSVFWIGSFDKDDPDAGILDDHPRALFRTPVKGGDSTVMFQAPKDLSGLNPSSAFGRALALTDSEVIFGSLNTDAFTLGIYRIAKTAEKGTPTKITDTVGFNSGFVLGSAVYTSNGDAIDRVAIDGGTITRVACGATPDSTTYVMGHDDTHVYYVRFTKSKADEIGQELRSAALPK